MRANIQIYHQDCMTALRDMRDNCFELAIVDPPYFSGPEKRQYYGNETCQSKHSKTGKTETIKRRKYLVSDTWNVPDEEYFFELFRVSKNQIIFGCNYYEYKFPSGRIVWNKCNGDSSFSDCEIAYCSLHDSVRMFTYMWNGMMQGKSITEGHIQQGNKKLNEKRFHPTQKPIVLYKWLLDTYAEKGDKIIDTHLGAGSIAIACWDMGFDLTCYEIDQHYYKLTSERLMRHKEQGQFDLDDSPLISTEDGT